MRHSRYLNIVRLELVMTLGVVGAVGCGANGAEDGAAGSEPVGHTEQAIIPGATITQTSRIVTLPAGSTLTDQQVNCPSGSVVVGGGYLSAPNTRVYTSAPNFNGWTVSIQNLSNATSYPVNLVAECLSGTNATSGLVAPGSAIIPKGGSGCVWASCPAGRILTAGGYTAPSSFRASSNQLFTDGRWQICGWNENSGSSIMVFAYPLCLSGVTGSAIRRNKQGPSMAPGTSVRVDSDPCASGLLLGSGGYQVASRSVYTRGSTRSFQDSTRWSNQFVNLSLGWMSTGVTTTCLDLWQ